MARKILIVDDEPNIIAVLSFLLEQNGCQVMSAQDGVKALKIVSSFDPDLIFLDILLSGPDGFEICQTLKDNPELQHIKIVFLSALGNDMDIATGIAMGADDYISKPFLHSDIIDVIEKLLGENRV